MGGFNIYINLCLYSSGIFLNFLYLFPWGANPRVRMSRMTIVTPLDLTNMFHIQEIFSNFPPTALLMI